MRILVPTVSRGAIDAEIRAAAYPGHVPARWALPLIDLVHASAGEWVLAELEHEEFAALWIPEHAGEPCHGDSALLGRTPGGSTLEEAATWLTTNAESYAAANPSCWGRIAHAAAGAVSPLVVSPFAVGDRLKPEHAALVVVDGLHRALGYWLAGRRTCAVYLPPPA